jgi:hypothetical protein
VLVAGQVTINRVKRDRHAVQSVGVICVVPAAKRRITRIRSTNTPFIRPIVSSSSASARRSPSRCLRASQAETAGDGRDADAAIDLEAAREHGVTVCGTASRREPPADLTWA